MDWVTKRIKAADLQPTENDEKLLKLKVAAEAVAEEYAEYGLTKDNVEIVRKWVTPDDLKVIKNERAVVGTITTNRVDRDGEVVDPAGAMLDDYRKNPVVMYGHDYHSLPIGKNIWVKATKDGHGLVAKTEYANHAQADEIYQYRKDGFPLGQSIGFAPIEWEDHKKGAMEDGRRRTYTKWALLEYSDVPIPANPDALQLAISKGWIEEDHAKEMGYVEMEDEEDDVSKGIRGRGTKVEEKEAEEKETEITQKPETTDKYHRVPVAAEAGKHTDHRIRTITISSDDGIKALYCTDDKVNITYLFDVDEWSMADAKKWVAEHKDVKPEDVEEKDAGKEQEDEGQAKGSEEAPAEEGDSEGREETSAKVDYVVNVGVTGLDELKQELAEVVSWITLQKNEQEENDPEEKAGRVLSKKTRKLLTDAAEALQGATEALGKLLEDADKKPEEEIPAEETKDSEEFSLDDVEEVGLDDILIPEEEQDEITPEKVASLVADAVNELYTVNHQADMDEAKRQRGKVF